ncbi:glutamate 5-kinase [Anaeromicrobium sediminis]|uniref:Glutamate 5-kinase n=2 Tax=Anaeromicrobium sediminis TaxID=1478221 RepID=A0A267MHT4_9FIRM|nr:glutamate 5-kinase [Anaeromicrobium sediminis]
MTESEVKSKELHISNIKRIVVKVGTSTLTHSTGLLNLSRIENIVRQLADIHNRGVEVVLVTSGAIGAGVGKLGLDERPKTIPEKQAAAAIGQGVLLHMYSKFFSEYGKITGQILLTRDDMADRNRFLNASNTFTALLDKGVIPVVNENDATVVDEIKFGDNDTLSAMVASLVNADLLVLLTDIDGLYDSNPKENKDAKRIEYVGKIDESIDHMAKGAGSKLGTGGMITKIKACKIASFSGVCTVIANGSEDNILNKIMDGEEVGTFFQKTEETLKAKKHWMAFVTNPTNKIYIDDGAQRALLENRKSLLPAGIVKVDGQFGKGEVLAIFNMNNEEIAHGVTNYNSTHIDMIKGIDSSEIERILGYKDYDEVIHANNLVVLRK